MICTMTKFDISNPSGFPEFSPAAEALRQDWVQTIMSVFQKYGFINISTPLVEREENLLGKGGNAKEMYALKRVHAGTEDDSHSGNALRFDHTVPLALYVARHFNDLTFPFKRCAIGPVFRGERAQKGRFRQFDQCDIDIIGNGKLDIKNDALVIAVVIEIFQKLKIGDFKIRINNRKIFAQISSDQEIVNGVIKVLDDLEKIGEAKVRENLESLGVDAEMVLKLIKTTGSNAEILDQLGETGTELREVVSALQAMGVDDRYYEIDLSIARGLDYYTGTVYETQMVNHPEFGSVCSGGRYDDLASVFTNKNLPGVGISIGLTRLFSQCLDAGVITPQKASPTKALLIAADEIALPKLLEIGTELRAAGIVAENYLESKKLAKQFDYADKLKIPYCVVMGERELEQNVVQLKNMKTGEQRSVNSEDLLNIFT